MRNGLGPPRKFRSAVAVARTSLLQYSQLGIGWHMQACVPCILERAQYWCSTCQDGADTPVLTACNKGKPDECIGRDCFAEEYHPMKKHTWRRLTEQVLLNM